MAKSSEKSAVKDTAKQLMPCIFILFVFCYMLFIYEPLIMYCTNKDDFIFDFGLMIMPTAGIFALIFVGSAAVFGLLYLFIGDLPKGAKIFRIVTAALFGVFLVMYIQGNFLTRRLPALDGSQIDWSQYTTENVITVSVVLIVASLIVLGSVYFGLEKTVKVSALVSAAVFVMLNAALISNAAQNDIFERKDNFIATMQDIGGASEEQNYFIFMVDAQNAQEFTQVITSDNQFAHTFDDFTYYTDALAAYPFTRDTVPLLLSGAVNRNEKPFAEYSANAYNSSPLFDALDKRGYSIRLYDMELAWYGDKEHEIENGLYGNAKMHFGRYFKNEMRYVWFKYLPYFLKPASDIENLDFNSTLDADVFQWYNDKLYREITENPKMEKTSGAQFRFIHAEGAHVPLNMDENLNRIENGTYLQKTTATVKLIDAFIERLKDNGVYDNSVIVILADHGFPTGSNGTFLARFAPMLLIKGAGEKHDLVMSDKPVSYFDLPDALVELLDGKQSGELFPQIPEGERTRTLIWYEYTKEYHMVEYQTDGKATDWEQFQPTGRVFDLAE